jgi:hypothetical protein
MDIFRIKNISKKLYSRSTVNFSLMSSLRLRYVSVTLALRERYVSVKLALR